MTEDSKMTKEAFPILVRSFPGGSSLHPQNPTNQATLPLCQITGWTNKRFGAIFGHFCLTMGDKKIRINHMAGLQISFKPVFRASSPCGCVFPIPLLTSSFHNATRANKCSTSPSPSSLTALNDVAIATPTA